MMSVRSGISVYTLGLPAVLFGALALSIPDFLAGQNLANVIGQITALLIVTLGQLVVALVAGIDLSVGSVAAGGELVIGRRVSVPVTTLRRCWCLLESKAGVVTVAVTAYAEAIRLQSLGLHCSPFNIVGHFCFLDE